MSTATAEPEATKPPSAFSNSIAEAFKAAEAEPTIETPPDAPPTPKREPTKAKEKPAEKTEPEPAKAKTGTPRELFNKQSRAAKDEPAKSEEAPTSAVDAIAEPDFKGDTKARSGWDALKTEAKTWERKTLDMERRDAERKAAGKDSETLETRLAERDARLKEYDGIVTRARLEDHPDFRREFVDGRTELVQRAQTIIEESGGDKEAIATALNLKGKARVDALREVAGELDNFQAGRLGRVIDELTNLDTRGDAKRSDAQKAYDELRATERQREAETGAKRAQDRKVLFDDTARRLTSELEVLTKADGYDDHNKQADSILADSRAYCEAHPEADPEAEILARSIPAYRDLFVQADDRAAKAEAENAKLKAELTAIHGKSPSLTGRRTADSSNGEKPQRPFISRMESELGGGG